MRHKKFWLKVSLVVGIFLFIHTAIISHPGESSDYDILIKNGLVIDGGLGKPVQADIAVIDIKNIRTPASLSNPHQYSQGVIHLMVNGEPVIEGGQWTGKLPGKILKPEKN